VIGGCGMTEKKEDNLQKYRDELLENIKDLVQKQGDALECVYVRYAAFRDDEYNRPQLFYLNLKFGKDDDENLDNSTSDWGPLIVETRTVSLDDALKAIESLIVNGVFSIDTIEPSDVDIVLNIKPHSMTSNVSDLPDNWPYHRCNLPVRHIRKQLPSQLPVLLGRPYYPTLEDATTSMLNLQRRSGRLEGIKITIPDYRAKIDNLHIGEDYVAVDISTGIQSEEDCVVKIYASGENGSIGSSDLKIRNGQAFFKTNIEPEYVNVVLLSQIAGDLIDTRIFSSFGLLDKTGPIHDDFEKQILELVKKGEGPRIEFKLRLNQDKKREYMETIVAFANARGGYLIIGVNEYGEIKGTHESVEELLRNQIHSMCNPSIDVTIRENIRVEDATIIVVQVPEGEQKPYFLQGRGYMRFGSTDRVMKREELEKMFNKDKPIFPGTFNPWGPGF
jgi:hypothetical protein